MERIGRLIFSAQRESTMFVIKSSLGSTDCSDCRIFTKGTALFAKNLQQPEFVSLPIKIAEMPNVAVAIEALRRIRYAIKRRKLYVNLTDLE